MNLCLIYQLTIYLYIIAYLVKWKNYPDREASWVMEQDLDCPYLLKQFQNESTNRKDSKTKRKKKKTSI